MEHTFEQEAAAPFPRIRFVLRNKRRIAGIATGGAALLGIWLAVRTGIVDFYALALLLAAAVHMVTNVAIEVIELVAETLMPR